MNAVDEIREAAELMRQTATRAVAAVGDESWHFLNLGWSEAHGITYTVESTAGAHVADVSAEEPAEHIASWHPAVALAVASLLDEVAFVVQDEGYCGGSSKAIRLARVYLGRGA